MAGIGETDAELLQTFHDLRDHDVDILTIGQYLQPTREHLPIDRWVTPEQFAEYKRHCLEDLKFAVVESGPLVRSSYHAEEQAELKYLQSPALLARLLFESCGKRHPLIFPSIDSCWRTQE